MGRGAELLKAVNNNQLYMVMAILSETTKVYNFHEKALLNAVVYKHLDILKELVDYGVSLEVVDKWGYTPLQRASSSGNIEVVQFLLERGANIESKNECGTTALMVATFGGHTEIIAELLKNGADMNAQNNRSLSALMIAKNNPDVISVFEAFQEQKQLETMLNDGSLTFDKGFQ